MAVPRDKLQRISKTDSKIIKKTAKRRKSSTQSLVKLPKFQEQDMVHSSVSPSPNSLETLSSELQIWTTVPNASPMAPSNFIPNNAHWRDSESQYNLPAIIPRNESQSVIENSLHHDSATGQESGRHAGHMYVGCHCYKCQTT
jgi:hypothetical protein